jgi:hypothetical protein
MFLEKVSPGLPGIIFTGSDVLRGPGQLRRYSNGLRAGRQGFDSRQE